jgi:hypothetical protein
MAYLRPEAGLVRQMRSTAGAPTAGTDEVQTITIGGTPTGGTFTLRYRGRTTAPITWSSTNGTLIANIDAALEALDVIGTGGVTTAVGSMTAGIGTATVTFVGTNAKKAHETMTVGTNSLTGTAPTVAVAETTPGVNASHRGAPVGASLVDRTAGKAYINTGTATVPTWTVVGSQS